MGVATFPATGSKTRYVVTLRSGTSWTVPANCLYVNAKLFGAGSGAHSNAEGQKPGMSGETVSSYVATTPGASIPYVIGAGSTGQVDAAGVSAGGTTSFTGATSALGGNGPTATSGLGVNGLASDQNNGGGITYNNIPGSGGPGKIELEYWA